MTELNLTTGDETAAAATPAETTDTSTAATTSPAMTNDKRLADLKKQVTKLGEESSLGRDSLPKLAHAVVRAAADGIIDTATKDKDGNDSATTIYAAYSAAESKKAIHEHSDGGKKANISKLRQLISMGEMTSIDAVAVMQDAFQARENMIADSNKVLPAYPFYVTVAREQLKADKALDLPALEKLVLKPEPPTKELEKELQSIMKKLEDLVTGEGKSKLKDTDELTEAAFNAVKERLDKMASARATMVLREQAAKLGYKLA